MIALCKQCISNQRRKMKEKFDSQCAFAFGVDIKVMQICIQGITFSLYGFPFEVYESDDACRNFLSDCIR